MIVIQNNHKNGFVELKLSSLKKKKNLVLIYLPNRDIEKDFPDGYYNKDTPDIIYQLRNLGGVFAYILYTREYVEIPENIIKIET